MGKSRSMFVNSLLGGFKRLEKQKLRTSRYLFVYALLGIIGSLTLNGCLSHLEEEMRSHLQNNFVQSATRNIQDGFITLAIKFLNFCIAKCIQFRYSSPLLSVTATTSMLFWLFWVALITSISSLYY